MSKNGLELNRIAAAVLVAGIIAMVAGFVADGLYEPKKVEKRGFEVAVEEAPAGGAATAPKEFNPDVKTLMAAADAAAGQEVAKKCAACHTFDKGGPNRVGPNLWGIVNAAKAHLGGGFGYSPAILEVAGKGEKWTYENLFKFLHNPKAYMPGTKMAFAGINKEQDLANLVAYLRSQADSQAPLP